MGLVKRVYNEVGKLASEGGGHPDFRSVVQRTAYFASQSEGGREGPDFYWYTGIAYCALKLLEERERETARCVQFTWPSHFYPSHFKTLDPVGELDPEDLSIMSLGLRFGLNCSSGDPDIFWWTSRRKLVGLEDIYPVSAPRALPVQPSELKAKNS